MREIKFRVWLDYFQKMFYDVHILGEELVVSLDGDGYDFIGDYKDFDVMQYTGIKDKNGREIYEKDVVCFVDERESPKIERIGIVSFADGSFFIDCVHSKHYRWMDYEVEVIGNDYDLKHNNPGKLLDFIVVDDEE